MKWLAPAKINLSLRVLGRRDDGFHEIETRMVPLSLADEIGIQLTAFEAGSAGESERVQMTCSDPSLPAGRENLAYQAAQSFLARYELRGRGIGLTLEKRVPHGAGLGGGSSDAATVLLALNELAGVRAPPAELALLAAELGSDVPFFVYQSAAICRGRGERVEPVALGEPIPLLLLKPPFPISTPWAYSRWRGARELPGVLYAPQDTHYGVLTNDLERPVFEKYLILAAVKMWLLAQPEIVGALLSGSGSTMLAVLRGGTADGEIVAAHARERFGDWWTYVCTSRAQP